MSKIFSFRLNDNNPREARVLELLHNELGAGYNLRQIIVEAILKLDEYNPNRVSISMLNELNLVLTRVNCLLEIFEGQSSLPFSKTEDISSKKLTTTFIDSVNKSFQPGIKIESSET